MTDVERPPLSTSPVPYFGSDLMCRGPVMSGAVDRPFALVVPQTTPSSVWGISVYRDVFGEVYVLFLMCSHTLSPSTVFRYGTRNVQ